MTLNSRRRISTLCALLAVILAGCASKPQAGYGAGVVVAFIPIPFPIFYSAMTESTTCRTLGEAVARFIVGGDLSAR
jgi:hypothetical protein